MIRVPLPDAPAPHRAHARLAARFDTTFILESRDGPRRLARYSFVGFDPAGTLVCGPAGVTVTGALPAPSRDQAPLEYLRRVQAFYRVDDHESPFVGGLVGTVGYDFARVVEPVLDTGGPEAWPRFLFGLYLDGIVYDHAAGTTTYVSRGEDRSRLVRDTLAEADEASAPVDSAGPLRVGAVAASVTDAAFADRVRAAQDLVRAGECFQIVLSRAFTAPFDGDLGGLYAWLREAAAVPYLYFLRFAGRALMGASPETLVRVRRGVCESFPIAGTRPVTGDEDTDQAAAADLRKDRKECAEHAMLVDLARNDLSRVCAPGTVQVHDYQRVERFRDVQHMVTRVTGDLAPGRDALDALAAVFPAGTVSGAPKVRAMEHIARLEDRPRGPYAGAVAYVSFNDDVDSAIAIRSLSAADGMLTVQAGAGIVHGSDPDSEAAETLHKARTLLDGLERFGATLPPQVRRRRRSTDASPDAAARAVEAHG